MQIRTDEMDRLAECGIAAYYSGRWMAERNSDAMVPFARNEEDAARAIYPASNSLGSSSYLNDADIARRVSRAKM